MSLTSRHLKGLIYLHVYLNLVLFLFISSCYFKLFFEEHTWIKMFPLLGLNCPAIII